MSSLYRYPAWSAPSAIFMFPFSAPTGAPPANPKDGRSMKLAVSSASFAADLASGALTQLEWLDLCAAELEADGVLFDLRHFPRLDDQYVAQVKKTAVDLGLTVAGLAVAGVEESEGGLALALALGA